MTLTLAEVAEGGKGLVAKALSDIEQDLFSAASICLLDAAFQAPRGHVLGITGPPGAGKSTLINALLGAWRASGVTVAVLAVDPSSKLTGGALLGDRIRMQIDPDDSGVFVRSCAARGRLGGLADVAYPAVVLLRALYDRVIVESVGVGQSDTEIARVSDTTILCIQPASGDSLQFMKAGIGEIPDLAVVTKADMGAPAARALADLRGALGLIWRDTEAFEPRCLAVSTTAGKGLDELFAALLAHEQWLEAKGRLFRQRSAQARHWIEEEIAGAFGRRGLVLARPILSASQIDSPFTALQHLMARLKVVIDA